MPFEVTLSKIFFFFCLSFIIGIFIGSLINFPLIIISGLFISSLILSGVFYNKKLLFILGLCIIFLCLGVFRVNHAISYAKNNDFRKYFGKTIEISGIVLKEVEKTAKSQRIILKTSLGKAIITAYRYPEYEYKDYLKIFGKIEEPQEFNDFDYKSYLLKDGIFAQMLFPKIEIVGDPVSYNFFSLILTFKEKTRSGIEKYFSPPKSEILEGMVLGDNFAMSNDLKEKLNKTGLRHIISISGSHIVIISGILMYFFLFIGLWRSQAFYFSSIGILLFIAMAGFPASGVRAGIMGFIFLLAIKLGRKNASSRSIVLACAIMLVLNPMLLIYDVGFQLSFSASLGIIFLMPVISNYLHIKNKDIRDGLAMTLSAQIFTLPVMLYNFSSFSLISIISNILILPVVSFIMIFGFLSALFSFLGGIIAWIFFFPTWLFLSYFLFIINFLSLFSNNNIGKLSFIWLVISYLVLGIVMYFIKKSNKLRFLK